MITSISNNIAFDKKFNETSQVITKFFPIPLVNVCTVIIFSVDYPHTCCYLKHVCLLANSHCFPEDCIAMKKKETQAVKTTLFCQLIKSFETTA